MKAPDPTPVAPPPIVAAPPGEPADPIQRLFKQAYQFSFFQAVRLLLRARRARDRERGGTSPGRPPVWFRSRVSSTFAPSEVVALEEGHHDPREVNQDADTVMTVAFMALAGHDGALPDPYAARLLERARARDYAFQSFLGMFNHRLIDLFYRAWEKHRFYIPLERGEEDPVSRILYALMGMHSVRTRRATGLAAEELLSQAALLTRRPLSAGAARVVLEQHFPGVPIRLEQFVGRWLGLDDSSQCRLGPRDSGGRLGRPCVLGKRIWDVQGQLLVRVGPLTHATFLEFSPGGSRARQLQVLLSFLTGGECDVAVELVHTQETGTLCHLGRRTGIVYRLGQSTWLGVAPGTRKHPNSTLAHHEKSAHPAAERKKAAPGLDISSDRHDRTEESR